MSFTRRLALVNKLPTDAEGNPLSGYVQVGEHSDGRIYLDCADEAPEGAEIVTEGLDRYEKVKGTEHAGNVLDAIWERTVKGETIRERGRQGWARAMGRIPASIAEDLPPHAWLGD